MRKLKLIIFIAIILSVITGVITVNNRKDNKTVENINTNVCKKEICQYELSDENIKALPSKNIENGIDEQSLEVESFEEQGPIAYNGDEKHQNINLGNYIGLTYYSQIDSRWASHPYTSINKSSQTIGTSGCGPTCASMVVTATRGTITPPEMGDLFVEHGYRSANNGTYLSAFRFVADTFNIEYNETYKLDNAINLLNNNYYVVASCGNGLFTTGGHLILIVGVENDTLKIYDPFLYNGKFETSTRRGKVTVSGNTVYCSISNFRKYANYTRFFAYKHDSNVPTNNYVPSTNTNTTMYVKANGGLNVRSSPNGKKVGALSNGSQVIVYETQGNWSRIGTNRWVCSDYLTNSKSTVSSNSNTKVNTKKYSNGSYKVNASLLNVRTGPGTNYKAKKYNQLSQNARKQNKALGNAKANGYKKGVICTVTKVNNNWGLTKSGWICLDYCRKQ
jgi:uncharacterized protein YraI